MSYGLGAASLRGGAAAVGPGPPAASWLQPLAHEDREENSPVNATECFLVRERERPQSAFLELAGESRRPRTLSNLRHPALETLWWLASRR